MYLDDNKISDSPNWTFISDISEGSDDISDGRSVRLPFVEIQLTLNFTPKKDRNDRDCTVL